MELKSFVQATLRQIVEGIQEAQRFPGGHIAAEGYIGSHGNLINAGTSGFFTIVNFDVSVAAENTTGGASVRVAGLESVAQNKEVSTNLSRVKFSVHLRLPKGGANLDVHHGSRHSTIKNDEF